LINIPQIPSSQSILTGHILSGQKLTVNLIQATRAARYAPFVLPANLNDLPGNDYMEYLPKFYNEGDKTTEEHLTTFYSLVDNFQIDHDDAWMRLFAKSLDGEVRKWLRSLQSNSINTITDFDAVFLRKWGDKKK